jgi:hypothetical protein
MLIKSDLAASLSTKPIMSKTTTSHLHSLQKMETCKEKQIILLIQPLELPVHFVYTDFLSGMYRTIDETESKIPSIVVLVQEQLNSLILSSEIQVKESGDFTSDTLALDEHLITVNHFSENRK